MINISGRSYCPPAEKMPGVAEKSLACPGEKWNPGDKAPVCLLLLPSSLAVQNRIV